MCLVLFSHVGGYLGFSVCAFHDGSRLRSGTLGIFYLRGAPSGIIGTIGLIWLLWWSFLLAMGVFGQAIDAPLFPVGLMVVRIVFLVGFIGFLPGFFHPHD